MTFVILSGGIDLSVGSVYRFHRRVSGEGHWCLGVDPLLAFPLVLAMGCGFWCADMGLADRCAENPGTFIITLAGMFFLRGVSYLVSEGRFLSIIPLYDTLSGLAWTIPGSGRLAQWGC